MKHISKKIILLLIISMIFTISISNNVYAVEDNVENITIDNSNKPVNQPYINEPLDNAVPVIYKYEIYKEDELTDSIVPGEEFTLKLTIYNPAVVSKIGNIRVDIIQADGLIYPKYGRTNQVYIGYLEPLSYGEGKIKLIASKKINIEQIGLLLQMSYTDNYNTFSNQQLVATLPVSSSGMLELSSVDIPSNMYVGARNRISISYQNNGLSNVNDVILFMNGDSIDEQQVTLGNLASGSSNTSDIYLQLKKSGAQSIKMHFTYADIDGVVHETEAQEYSITASEFVQDSHGGDDHYNENRNLTNRFITIVVIIISFAVVAIFLFREIMKIRSDKALVKDKKL